MIQQIQEVQESPVYHGSRRESPELRRQPADVVHRSGGGKGSRLTGVQQAEEPTRSQYDDDDDVYTLCYLGLGLGSVGVFCSIIRPIKNQLRTMQAGMYTYLQGYSIDTYASEGDGKQSSVEVK